MPIAPNPMRSDPSRTITLRRQLSVEFSKRFDALKKELYQLIVVEDAFGLRRLTANVGRWEFRTTPEKLQEFQRWLNQRVRAGLLPVAEGDTKQMYWRRFIEAGYKKGAGRSFDDVKKKGIKDPFGTNDFYKGSKEQFLSSSFAQQVSLEKLELLAGRVYTDLNGVTQAMSTKITRELTDGLVQGQSPRVIAKMIADTVDGIGKTRALTIARTEIVRAHAEGQLDALENLGVNEIGVSVEWSTTGDLRVCPLCRPLQGVVLSLKEARGLLPRHPNCRCAYIPANVGESKAKQKRGKAKVETALDKSILAERPKGTSLSKAKSKSSWIGADRKIKKKRPRSILKKEIK